MIVRAKNADAIKALSSAPWVGFWAQGESPFQLTSHPGVYGVLGSLVIDLGERKVEVGAAAVDIAEKDEEFPVAAWFDAQFGEESHEVRFRPRRCRLAQFPEDLGLGDFRDPPRTLELVQEPGDVSGRTVESALIIECAKERLLIYSGVYGYGSGLRLSPFGGAPRGPVMPLDLTITTDQSYIENLRRCAVAMTEFANWIVEVDRSSGADR